MRLIIDAHLDIAWNAVSFDRDQLLSIPELRENERGMTGKGRGNCTTSLPEMRKGSVGVALGTVLSRALPKNLPDLDSNMGPIGDRAHGEIILRENLDFANQTICCAAGQAQLAYYKLLQQQGHMRMIGDRATLDEVWALWESSPDTAPIGNILSMEGTDPIIDPSQAEWWFKQGLRTACLAHYGPSAYSMGTGGDGPLTDKGRELLKEMERLGIILDLVHTADTAIEQALEIYSKPVFISHGDCRAITPHDRQISDQQIRWVVERGGVIGVVLDSWMIAPGWERGATDNARATLEQLVDHIDHICKLAGNTSHVGIGSDLDGGFGTEQAPQELDTIADLQKIGDIMSARGYTDTDIDGVFHANFLRFFRENLPG
ncbi:MAG: membrane dipeptidase [Acidobacteria bacterium]|nr:membrane dipeptidase [Acidobacteriota bacterium]